MDDMQFSRLIQDIQRSRDAYESGDLDKCRRIMAVVASIALANSVESDPNAPVPENDSARG